MAGGGGTGGEGADFGCVVDGGGGPGRMEGCTGAVGRRYCVVTGKVGEGFVTLLMTKKRGGALWMT